MSGGERVTIRESADALLRKTGLMDVLNGYGEAAIVGSYAMDAMAWNDLDVYIALDGDFHEMAGAAMRAVQPVRFDGFCDAGRQFLGMETVITGERWNIDVWIRTVAEMEDALAKNRAMKRRFDAQPEARQAMLDIKRALIARGMYGFDKGKRHYHSPEIYDAVLEKGVRTVDELLEAYPV